MKDYVQKFKRFCLIFSARIAGAGALFAANLLIARELGFENLATYAVFVSLVSIGAVIVSSGFPAVAPIFVTEYSTLDKPGYIKGFARKALGQGAKLCFLLSAIFMCLWTLNLDTALFARIDVVIAIMIAICATATKRICARRSITWGSTWMADMPPTYWCRIRSTASM